MEEKVFYKMLEIPKHCTDEELKKAYYRAAKKYHPDFCSNEQATKMFSDISITYKRILAATTPNSIKPIRRYRLSRLLSIRVRSFSALLIPYHIPR